MHRPFFNINPSSTQPILGVVMSMQRRMLCLIMVAVFLAGSNGLVAQTTQSAWGDSESSTGGSNGTGELGERAKVQFPYQAIVRNEQTPVHSGPGETHYATGELPQNSTVAVYRHDPGGWCAIRPPRDSFSLVPATSIEIVEGEVGRVVDDGTQVWVGTQLGAVEKPLWQIKLKAGELVEILGEANWPNPDGHSTTWYQIAPPAGEFRWIRLSDLQVPPRGMEDGLEIDRRLEATTTGSQLAIERRLEATTTADAASFAVQPATFQSDESVPRPTNVPAGNRFHRFGNDSQSYSGSDSANDSPDNSRNSVNHGWRQATRPINRERNENSNSSNQPFSQTSTPDRFAALPVSNASDPSASYQGASHPNFQYQYPQANETNGAWSQDRLASTNTDPRFALEQLRPRSNSNSSNFGLEPSVNTIGSGLRGSSSALLSPRLTQLELRLNREMIKEPNQWRLIDLQTEAKSIVATTTNPTERAQAGQLLSKLENCTRIRTNYLAVFKANSGGNTSANTGINASRNGSDQSDLVGVDPTNDVSLDTLYDAHGWLFELVRDGGQGRSTYVLKDNDGRIVYHVSPEPGLSLSPYLKTKIGVMGKRGYHTDLKLDHVTAERIIELKRR
jgi:hypothetical protein